MTVKLSLSYLYWGFIILKFSFAIILEEVEKVKEVNHTMDCKYYREIHLDIDLESGGTDTSSDENGGNDSNLGLKRPNKLLSRLRSGHLSSKNSDGSGPSKSSLSSDEALNLLVSGMRRKTEDFGDTIRDKKKNKMGYKQHSKPPRHPRSPSLDSVDMKLVQEISEHSRLRHAKIERTKALMKRKVDNSSSLSSYNYDMVAMVVTIVFFFVIIYQGNFNLLVG